MSHGRVTVRDMQITDPDGDIYWHKIAGHTADSDKTGAPWPVQVQVAALVANAGIEASIVSFDGTGPSIWAVTLVTADKRLIRVRMTFASQEYDVEKDRVVDEPLVATDVESWVRRLSDVESLKIGRSRTRPISFNRSQLSVLDVSDVALIFRDGVAVDLGVDQVAMSQYDDRERSDAFVDLVRGVTGL